MSDVRWCRCGHEQYQHRPEIPVGVVADRSGVMVGWFGNCTSPMGEPGECPWACPCPRFAPTVSEGLWP